MDLDLSIEQKLLLDNARAFLNKECPMENVRELMKSETGHAPALWGKMAELGWLGMIIPEVYGGSDGDFIDLAIHLEAMGEICLPGPFFSTAVLGATAILLAGSPEQKKALLPRISKGDLILSLAVAEPGGGYDASTVSTSAVKQGAQYILNGTKLFVDNAHIADTIICVAKTNTTKEPGAGLTMFLVDRDNPGVHCESLDTLGYEKLCEVVFDKVRLGEKHILGEPGKAIDVLKTIEERAAVAKCAELVGCIRTAFDMAVSYAKQREQFGRPIGSFQAIQHHCANMAMDVDSTRFLTYQAVYRIAKGLPASREVAMAKAWASEASGRVTRLAHQIHGAIAFCQEHDLHLYYRRAKAAAVAYGDSSYHYEKVANQLNFQLQCSLLPRR
ncbi:MAG: acyl-CoA/acyl-ACP dehydrogenase [Deltaproteobacteria bacterium]|nr:acyl-CoA/acyl-ACP dehydrogenase [Deltaproteobacteria bacterium]